MPSRPSTRRSIHSSPHHDTCTLLPVRAIALEQLSQLIDRHLDHEEESALPLICRHYSAEEWEAEGKCT